MSKKDKKSQAQLLEERKNALKQTIEEKEVLLQESIGEFKKELSEKKDPRYWVRRFPWAAAGSALVIGIIAGASSRRTTNVSATAPAKGNTTQDFSAGNVITQTLKKRALEFVLQKGVAYAQHLLEQKLAEKMKKED